MYVIVRCPVCGNEIYIHENGKITNVCDEEHLSAIKRKYSKLLRKTVRKSYRKSVQRKKVFITPKEFEEGINFEANYDKSDKGVLVLDDDDKVGGNGN